MIMSTNTPGQSSANIKNSFPQCYQSIHLRTVKTHSYSFTRAFICVQKRLICMSHQSIHLRTVKTHSHSFTRAFICVQKRLICMSHQSIQLRTAKSHSTAYSEVTFPQFHQIIHLRRLKIDSKSLTRVLI